LIKQIPKYEERAGDYKKLAAGMILKAIHDAMHLLVPMHAEEHVRKLMPYVAYQRGNPNSDIVPWARDVTEARHWLLNDGYDKWLAESGGLTMSWCAEQMCKLPDDLRAMVSHAIKLSEDAESMWLPTDLEKVKARITAVKREMETKLN